MQDWNILIENPMMINKTTIKLPILIRYVGSLFREL